MDTIRYYGAPPYKICLLHGGPGAAGEMQPVAQVLASERGVLEFFQTKNTLSGQLEELKNQIQSSGNTSVILIAYSWGAWLGLLFASRHPERVEKLIMISTPSFEDKYIPDLTPKRLGRLNPEQKKTAEKYLSLIQAGTYDDQVLEQLGALFALADAYDPDFTISDEIRVAIDIYRKVWGEAEKLRRTGALMDVLPPMDCPVYAIHGLDDPHPVAGVEAPLSARLKNFRMITLEKCGHTPWKEKQAKDEFFRVLRSLL